MYRIRTYAEAQEQVEALPDDALTSYAQTLGVLELAPWNGHPHNEDKPDCEVRQFVFGASSLGIVIYLILEEQRYVDVLQVIWFG